MPELPEVETVARQLQAVLPGEKVSRVLIKDARLGVTRPNRLCGYSIRSVERMGKQVVISFDKGTASLYAAIHLRMTGRLTWIPKLRGRRKPDARASDKAAFYYNDVDSYSNAPARASFFCSNGELRFSDVRRFGTLELSEDKSAFIPVGAEPLERSFNKTRLWEMLQSSGQEIKLWLLRQDKIVGIGNIYASEILFRAGISPKRAANSLSSSETEVLCRSIKAILRSAIARCGTTFSDFQDSKGELGSYQTFLKVYKKEGEQCTRCGAGIIREKSQGRSTFFCPACQR